MDEHFFRGITAEERVPVRNKRTNAIKYEWIKRYERNEPLDTMVYLTAAAFVLGFDRWNDARWARELAGVQGKPKIDAQNLPVEDKEPVEPERRERESEPEAQKTDSKGKKRRRGGGDSYWKRKF